MLRNLLVPCVLLLLLVLHHPVRAAWRSGTRKSRRSSAVKYQNDAASYGPNVCAVQEVFRTGEKFYPDCIKKRLKRICGRPTFVRYECCCGYGVVDGEEGCPAVDPLKNIRDTLLDLGLTQFPKLLTNTELEDDLQQTGAFTVFVPIDTAFNKLSHDQKQRLFPWTYNALTLAHYHVVPGWHHSDYMAKTEMLPTLYYGLKPVWISKGSKKDLHTVNCAKIIRSNILASNGVIHLIDQMLSPYDMFGNVTDVIFRDAQQFSQFIQVLYTSELVTTIRDRGIYTVFAPNNYAFSRVPKPLLHKILNDKDTAAAFIRHHISPGVHCGTANIVNNHVRMLDGTRLQFQCKPTGHYIHNSKVVKADILAGNGVIHMINKVQLPQAVQTIEQLARDMRLHKFLQLSYEAGLLDKLQTGPELTLFIPSDDAFNALPKSRKETLYSDPAEFEEIFDYHSITGKMKTDSFVGDKSIIVNSGNLMKLSVHRDGIVVDDAEIISPNNECYNGVIHVIDRVLKTPDKNLLEVISQQQDLRIFQKALQYSDMSQTLATSVGSFTVFSPTDKAFNKLPTWKFDEIFEDRDKVSQLMNNHMTDKLLIPRTITRQSILRLTSLQGLPIMFHRTQTNNYTVNKHSGVVEPYTIAKNGILYKIDRVLEFPFSNDPT